MRFADSKSVIRKDVNPRVAAHRIRALIDRAGVRIVTVLGIETAEVRPLRSEKLQTEVLSNIRRVDGDRERCRRVDLAGDHMIEAPPCPGRRYRATAFWNIRHGPAAEQSG